MKLKQYILILIIVGTGTFGCNEPDIPTADDHFLNYEIPPVPVETDYVVGALYDRFEWNSNVPETPSVGIYDGNMGDPAVYAQHIDQANTGGIDYFIFTLRSTVEMAEFQSDSLFISTLHQASNAGEMKYALSYNFGSMGLSSNDRIEDEGLVPTFLKDFELMLPYFQQANYMAIDGKIVVYMAGSHNLFSNDSEALYQQLRSQMSGLGVELYLIGEQTDWTPPLRYSMRFVNAVDAVTHRTYLDIEKIEYDRMIMLNKYCDQAWTYHQEALANYGLEYVPTVAPSINPTITNSTNTNYVIEKDAQFFAEHCNVARKVSGSNKLVILDSFNDWNAGKQIESATSYGDEFLNVLRQQFKVN
jgi:hypothetical protein